MLENIIASENIFMLLLMLSMGSIFESVWTRPYQKNISNFFLLLAVIFTSLLFFQDRLSKEKFRNTALTLPQIATLSSDVSKLCLEEYFYLHNINIVYVPQLTETFHHANCKFQIANAQSCTCEIKEHTIHHKVNAVSTCENNNGKIDCITNEEFY